MPTAYINASFLRKSLALFDFPSISPAAPGAFCQPQEFAIFARTIRGMPKALPHTILRRPGNFLPMTIGIWLREALLISAAIVTIWTFIASSALDAKTPGAIHEATWGSVTLHASHGAGFRRQWQEWGTLRPLQSADLAKAVSAEY